MKRGVAIVLKPAIAVKKLGHREESKPDPDQIKRMRCVVIQLSNLHTFLTDINSTGSRCFVTRVTISNGNKDNISNCLSPSPHKPDTVCLAA